MTRFPNRNAELFFVEALKRQIWIRIEEEVWRRDRILNRAQRMGVKHFFEPLANEELTLSKKDLKFLKQIKVKV